MSGYGSIYILISICQKKDSAIQSLILIANCLSSEEVNLREYFTLKIGGGFKKSLGFRETFCDTNIFHLETHRWEMSNQITGKLPPNRIHHGCARLGSIMLVMGG